MNFVSKLKIPTLLGLAIIFLGMGAAVFLALREQTLTTQASPDQTPQNVAVTNIEDKSLSISWQTSVAVPAFISYGQSSFSQTAIDDRDGGAPKPRTTHHITVKNLAPQTTYKFRLTTGKLIYPKILTFTTAPETEAQNGLNAVQGLGMEGSEAVSDGIVYLSVVGATIQSAPMKNLGNFIIPVSKMRREDLQDIFQPDQNTTAKIRLISATGEATAQVRLSEIEDPIGPLKIGQNLDLTIPATPSATPTPDTTKYDLNGDGTLNTSDYTIVRRNLGSSPKDKKADLNSDGVVDQKDLDLILESIRSKK